MEFPGNTGTELIVNLTSSILEAGWIGTAVAANGRATAQILTQYVADGSAIKLTLTDGEGHRHGVLNGQVISNIHRVQVVVPAAARGTLSFQAELPAHHLLKVSSRIRIGPAVSIEAPQWLDAQSHPITELVDHAKIQLRARVSGIPDGTACACRILSSKLPGNHVAIHEDEGLVKEGRIDFRWNFEYPHDPAGWPSAQVQQPDASAFVHASYIAEFTCMGVKVAAPPLPHPSYIEYRFENFIGTVKFELPDGRILEQHSDGVAPIRIPRPGVGEPEVLEIRPD